MSTDTDALVPVAWMVTRLLKKDDEGGKRVRYLHLSEGLAQQDFDGWNEVPGAMPQLHPLYGPDAIERLARERDEAVARERERVEAMTRRMRDIEARHMALLKAVADGVAMQPRTVVLVGDAPIRTTKAPT